MSLDVLSYLLRTGTVGLAAALLLLLVRRRSAATQHALAASALIAMLVLVPASFVLTHRLKPAYSTPIPISTASLPGENVPEPIDRDPSFVQSTVETVPPVVLSPPKASARPPIAAWRRWASRIDLFAMFANLWAIVSVLVALRLAAGLVTVGRRVSRAEPVRDLGTDFVWNPNELKAEANVSKPNELFEPDIRVDRDTKVPLAVWWGRRVVLLPPSWHLWTNDRLETVLRHESAHLDRGDCWIQLVASAACVMAWPNPLAWWLLRKTRNLSEQAVDDLILQSGIAPSRYAQDLLDIAHQSRDRLAGMLFPMSVKPEVSRRIEMILNDRKQRGAATLAAMTAMGLGFGGLAVGLSAWGLVPAQTAVTLGPAPEVSVLTAFSPTYSFDSASPGKDAEPIATRDEAMPGGVMANRTAGVEPKQPTGVQPVSGAGKPETDLPLRTIRLEQFDLGPKTDLSQFGIHDAKSKVEVEYVDLKWLPTLRTELTHQGAVAGPRINTIVSEKRPGVAYLGTNSNGTEFRVLVLKPVHADNSMMLMVKPGRKTTPKIRFATLLPFDKLTACLFQGGGAKGKNQLWLIESKAIPPSPALTAVVDPPSAGKGLESGVQVADTRDVPAEHRFKLVASLYRVTDPTGLESFGIGPKYVPGYQMSISEARLAELRKALDLAGAKILMQFPFHLADRNVAKIRPADRFEAVPIDLALRQNPDGSTTAVIHMFDRPRGAKQTRSKDGAGQASPVTSEQSIAIRFGPNSGLYLVLPDPNYNGRFDIWMLDLQTRPTKTITEALPETRETPPNPAGSRSVLYDIKQYALPAEYENGLHISIGPRDSKLLYAEATLGEDATDSLKKLLNDGPAKVVAAPKVRSLIGEPATCTTMIDGVENRLELNLSEDLKLSAHVGLLYDNPKRSRGIESLNKPIAFGSSRVILGPPDPTTKITPLWIITVKPGQD